MTHHTPKDPPTSDAAGRARTAAQRTAAQPPVAQSGNDPVETATTVAPKLSHWAVLAIAVPIMISNATTPLVGYADTVVIGRLGSEVLMGAVAIAANIFNYLYWVFGFLRMGTTGLTAQAAGAEDWSEVAAHLGRAVAIAVTLGLTLIVLQAVLGPLAFWLMGASQQVTNAAWDYFTIRIWSAPAALTNFALLGWFIGLGRADIAFALQLILNLTNIALAVLLVLVFGWGVPGVGLAILVAEVVAAVIGLVLAALRLSARGAAPELSRILNAVQIKRTFALNADIMIRTFCLLFAFAFFTSQGARAGDLTLAVNALLFSMAMIATYLLDGFAFAAETLVGQAIGARDRKRFREAVTLTTIWAAIAAVTLAALTLVAGHLMIDFAATNTDVRDTARVFLTWAALLPLVGVWCFQLDGIYIGATQSAEMRNMMIVSLVVYLASAAALVPALGNHGLWLALFVFFIVRALTLVWRFPVLMRKTFPAPTGDQPRPVTAT